MSGVRKGPPKHQNKVAWKPNAGIKINETVRLLSFSGDQPLFLWSERIDCWCCFYLQEVGGKFRPLSEITGVCLRCRDQIDWKRKYGKYKAITEPAKW